MPRLTVKCYSGHTYAERPESFSLESVEHRIKEIESAWLEPGERHFRVKTETGKKFHLWYNETTNEWSLTEIVERLDAEGNP